MKKQCSSGNIIISSSSNSSSSNIIIRIQAVKTEKKSSLSLKMLAKWAFLSGDCNKKDLLLTFWRRIPQLPPEISPHNLNPNRKLFLSSNFCLFICSSDHLPRDRTPIVCLSAWLLVFFSNTAAATVLLLLLLLLLLYHNYDPLITAATATLVATSTGNMCAHWTTTAATSL